MSRFQMSGSFELVFEYRDDDDNDENDDDDDDQHDGDDDDDNDDDDECNLAGQVELRKDGD